jgi:subfamily B ATP-binding cassette protein MsbA
MQDLKRLLRYLKPHWLIFSVATIAMVLGSLLESAIGGLIVPIFNQVFGVGGGERSSTLFGLQRWIPASGIEAWRNIALMLVIFTAIKGVAEYFSAYLMARVGQAAVLRLRQDLYSHILRQSASFFERHRTNYLVSCLLTSAANIDV